MGMVLAALFTFASVSRAGLYGITFTDPGGDNVGSGEIVVEGGYAVSGYFDVSAGTAIGDWILAPGSGSDGSFRWDNAVNPASDPFLTDGGLLFTSGGNEINLWGNSPGSYSLWGNVGGNYNPQVDFGVATITAIPEPINYALSGFGLFFVGVSVGRYCFCRRRFVRPAGAGCRATPWGDG